MGYLPPLEYCVMTSLVLKSFISCRYSEPCKKFLSEITLKLQVHCIAKPLPLMSCHTVAGWGRNDFVRTSRISGLCIYVLT